MENQKEMERRLLETAGLEELAEELPPLPEGCYELSPANPELKKNYIFYYPKTIDDVRRIAGVPREIANANREKMELPLQIAEIKEKVVELGKDFIPEDKELRQLAVELLLYPLEEVPSDGVMAAAHDYMMKRASVLPVLLAANLEVKDGEKYTIKNTASAVFGSIIIHGSGTIAVESGVKIIADSIQHVD